MDPTTGLPMAFGKQGRSNPDPASGVESSGSAERGGGVGRGSRGVVGGGKRTRGRGGGRVGGEAGENSGRPDVDGMTLNGGVKRPHPSSSLHDSLPPAPQSAYLPQAPSYGYVPPGRSNPNGVGLGQRGDGTTQGGFDRGYGQAVGRGRGGPPGRGGRGARGGMDGGGRGGGGGGRGGHAPPEKGFYKPSFAEDPWQELLEKRDRAAGANAA